MTLIEQKNNQIHLTSIDNKEKKITIIFDKKNFDLIGWEINDQFENKIVFLIEILSTNEDMNLEIFKVFKHINIIIVDNNLDTRPIYHFSQISI